MIFNLNDSGGGLGPARIVYSGTKLTGQDSSGWMAALLESGELRILATTRVDIAIVAGGQDGSHASGNGYRGGHGGEVLVIPGVILRSGVRYTVTIGGSNEDSSLSGGGLNYTARSGEGSSGGTPAVNRNTPATDGDPGVLIWGGVSPIQELAGVRFAPGGGAGGWRSADYAYYSGSAGGDDGGGDGGGNNGTTVTEATPGAANRGSGAGGRWRRLDAGTAGEIAAGGSGIVLIRPYKEVSA